VRVRSKEGRRAIWAKLIIQATIEDGGYDSRSVARRHELFEYMMMCISDINWRENTDNIGHEHVGSIWLSQYSLFL